jgi:peptide deformylase
MSNSPELDRQSADPVLQFDNRRLRQASAPIAEGDFDSEKLQGWITRLNQSRQVYGGIGIAAPQIGLFYRLVVIEIPAYERVGFGQVEAVARHALINPEITWFSEDNIKAAEGCLSVLNYEGFVIRPRRVRVVAYTPQGNRLEFEADSLYARCLQHEIDHLDGILYPDRIKELKDLRKIEAVKSDDPVLAYNRIIKPPTTTAIL